MPSDLILTLPEKSSRITKSLDYGGAALFAALIDGVLSSYTCTFAASANITATGNNFVTNMRVRFSTTGALPAEINATTDYWITSVSGATIQVSATRGGTAITMSGAGSGVHTVTEQLPIATLSNGTIACLHNLNCIVRHELTTYNQTPGRKAINLPATTDDYTTGQSSALITANFTPSSAITFRYLAILRDALVTTGDSTGTLVGLKDYSTTQTITTGGQTFSYNVAL